MEETQGDTKTLQGPRKCGPEPTCLWPDEWANKFSRTQERVSPGSAGHSGSGVLRSSHQRPVLWLAATRLGWEEPRPAGTQGWAEVPREACSAGWGHPGSLPPPTPSSVLWEQNLAAVLPLGSTLPAPAQGLGLVEAAGARG